MRNIINIVSGKGGTGKTLLTATLAELLGNYGSKVLVIDLDVFVRGLTALLYFQKGEALNITQPDAYTISNIFIQKEVSVSYHDLPIVRYRSFDIIPSVSRIDEILNFEDLSPDNKVEAKEILQRLLEVIPSDYEFIFLDSRAGYDELIAATHAVSDLSICVQEDDPISNVTADNLVKQLDRDSGGPIFRILNKVRSIDYHEFDANKQISSFTVLGSIPFDMDVMNSFGGTTFWEDISKSLYTSSIARIWNRLSKAMKFGKEIPITRISPFGNEKFESKIGILSIYKRVTLVMGFIVSLLGFIITFTSKEVLRDLIENPLRLISFVIAIASLFATFTIFFPSKYISKNNSKIH